MDANGGITVLTERRRSTPNDASQKAVLAYIENTFSKILTEIQKRPCGHPIIVLRRITALRAHRSEDQVGMDWEIKDHEVTYGFPGRTKDEAWRFACLGKILSEIYEAVNSNVVVTKRDIFYRDPELFKHQATVDRFIDDVAHTCKVTRADLNVAASVKGLVAGISCEKENVSELFELVPSSSELVNGFRTDQVDWILVVEKEATFRLLAENKLHQKPKASRGVLVTGKGYPDLRTRSFLRDLVNHSGAPVFGLFDSDPDGINIQKIYKFGSKTLAHEHKCNVPEMKWLGVSLEEGFCLNSLDRLTMEMTPRDRAKARAMLKGSTDPAMNAVCLLGDASRRDLQHMLFLNCKMEMQALEGLEGGMAAWVEGKLVEQISQ